jgi:hypothetical protein
MSCKRFVPCLVLVVLFGILTSASATTVSASSPRAGGNHSEAGTLLLLSTGLMGVAGLIRKNLRS